MTQRHRSDPSSEIIPSETSAADQVCVRPEHVFRSILVPLDGSDFGEHALPLAVGLARRLGAALELVHVHMPVWGMHRELGVPYDESLDREMKEQERAYIQGVVERLAAIAQVSPGSTLLDGAVVDAIIRHAAAVSADLLIMTTHARGPMARFWLGSVADLLVRQATIPVLLVRPEESTRDLATEQVLRRILIPLDGSDPAERVLEPALALCAATNIEFTLLRVVKPMTPASYDPASGRISGLRPSLLDQLQTLDLRQTAEAQDYLDRVAERLRARPLTVQTHVVSHEQPATAILEYASAHGADTIALATHGRGGLKRLLLGSVADKVIRGASAPVLVYRPA
jgi:nucleotide-binding universal stress UspA family protein